MSLYVCMDRIMEGENFLTPVATCQVRRATRGAHLTAFVGQKLGAQWGHTGVGRDDFHFLLRALFGHKTMCVCYREKHVGLHGVSWGDALYPPRNHTVW